MSTEKQLQTYEKLAKKLKRSNSKKVFLKERRIELLSNAKGKVLEVAVGTGANFRFYPPSVKITAVDFSPSLLDMAKSTAQLEGLQVDFIQADVEHLEFEEDSFDTIVSTLSLCAYDDPIGVLNSFNKFCKPGGQILLLEHGISTRKTYGAMLNLLLKLLNGWNLKHVGCHTDRDIVKIVEQSNIQIESVKTYFGGLNYLIIAKPGLRQGMPGLSDIREFKPE